MSKSSPASKKVKEVSLVAPWWVFLLHLGFPRAFKESETEGGIQTERLENEKVKEMKKGRHQSLCRLRSRHREWGPFQDVVASPIFSSNQLQPYRNGHVRPS
ncbi:hypothetical protein L1887_21066 [Cichorium endivia]|nr:hypothetical protein L1887_21066 [Cichorium endivia]